MGWNDDRGFVTDDEVSAYLDAAASNALRLREHKDEWSGHPDFQEDDVNVVEPNVVAPHPDPLEPADPED
jgi:hypothetical protein